MEAEIRALAAIVGTFIVVTVLWDGFETIIFPRRVTRKMRLTRLFYRYTWLVWVWFVNLISSKKRSETFLSFYGPLSLIFLLVIWAWGLVFGFGLLQWAAGPDRTPGGTSISFWTYFYFSGTNFFTLGIGDITPYTVPARILTMIEAGLGLGFLALILGYLPALNQSFARREETISLLDARAGSPPTAIEMLRRHRQDNGLVELERFLSLWERWASELLESHLSYPVLAYFRSQHDNESWLAALTAILDSTSLIMVYMSGPCRNQAELTFAMARHAVADLSIVFDTPPREPDQDRLPAADLDRITAELTGLGFDLSTDDTMKEKLKDLRHMYEPYLYALGSHLYLDVPQWIPAMGQVDNWRTNAWETITANTKQVSKGRSKHRHF